MKKIINQVDQIIDEMTDGIALANPELVTKYNNSNIIIRQTFKQNKVSLISGGGSGHEPTHAGYVGTGMLDAAVCGAVFTSPPLDQVYQAIKAVPNQNGVLLIVKNYTGDVLNFQMAQQMAIAEGIKVDHVIVADDVALDANNLTTGRRGLAGTVLVHKVTGAKAEMGASLSEVKAIALKAIANVGTYGIGLNGATVPANGKRGFELADDIVEMGLGIHGEPGIRQEKMKTADEFAIEMIEKIITDLKIKSQDEVVVLVNGLGATTNMELNIVARKVLLILKEKNIIVNKTFVGDYLTSLDMPGLSISLMKLDNELKQLINAPANTVALKVID